MWFIRSREDNSILLEIVPTNTWLSQLDGCGCGTKDEMSVRDNDQCFRDPIAFDKSLNSFVKFSQTFIQTNRQHTRQTSKLHTTNKHVQTEQTYHQTYMYQTYQTKIKNISKKNKSKIKQSFKKLYNYFNITRIHNKCF